MNDSSRRRFLKASALIAAGSVLAADRLLAISPENVMAASRKKVKDVGVQLYTVRKEMLADPKGTLQQLAAIGFKELESARSEKGNYYGLEAKEIKKIAGDLGMHLRSGHIHVDKDWQRSLEQAVESGQEYIISAVLPSQGQTIDHYKQSAEAFNKLGEECKKAGLHFGYHNHDSEFQTVDGHILYDVLLQYTDPALVTMEMDLGWVVAAGKDPFHYFDQYPGRFHLWHLKDMDMSRRQSTEFGKGQVDIKKLLQQAKQSGMKYFFLEQEEYAHTAFDSIKEDYAYLQALD